MALRSPRHETAGLIGGAPHRLVEDFARAIAFETSAEGLRAVATKRLQAVARARGAVFCEFVALDDRFVVMCSTAAASVSANSGFSAHGALARWLRVNGEPLLLADGSTVAEYLPGEERDVLRHFGATACLPLESGARLLAIVLLVEPWNGGRPSRDDLDGLMSCCRQTALAAESLTVRQADRDQRDAAARAEQLIVAGQLAASIAHEVRNPLAAIRSSVQYVADSQAPWPQKRELLATVLSEVDRIDRTIAGILGLSRPRHLDLADLDFIDVIERSLVLIQPYCAQQGLQLEARLERRPLPIRGDDKELRQVLLNVLLNACQATPAGGTITITSDVHHPVVEQPDAMPMALAAVADTGRGMNTSELARAFDPFFTTRDGGTGLGLPVCLEIMTRHQGAIRLESQLGAGTTALLTLPIRRH